MHPPDCPVFEYEHHPHRQAVLRDRTAEVIRALRGGGIDGAGAAADSRPIHRRLFLQLTPPGYDYYAGHYRGESFRCLQFYAAGIQGDPNVGYMAANVPMAMADVAREIYAGLGVLDAIHQMPHAHLPRRDKLIYTVVFVCRVFEVFLRVHPYANGNGHAARFVVWAILGRYGYWPQNWPIEPRPADPPYTLLIQQYRGGNRDPLEQFVVQALLT